MHILQIVLVYGKVLPIPYMTFYRLFLYMDRSLLFLYMDRSLQCHALHFTDCSCMWTGSSSSMHNMLQIVLVGEQVFPLDCSCVCEQVFPLDCSCVCEQVFPFPCMLQIVLVCRHVRPMPCITFYRLFLRVDRFFQFCTSHNS